MSRSNPDGDRPKNPAIRFFEWAAKKKQFEYYNKDAQDPKDATKKGANIAVPIPFGFLVLDQMHTIKGYNKSKKESYWSNDVRDLKNQKFIIRSKAGIKAEGLYEDIKGKVAGAKYHKSIYIAFFDENKVLQIGCMVLGGSAIGAWIEFSKGRNVNTGAIRIITTTEVVDEEGKPYYVPVFELVKSKEETNQKAIELDKILQDYFNKYFSVDHSEPIAPTSSTPHETPAEVINQQNKIDEPAAPVVSNDFDEEF